MRAFDAAWNLLKAIPRDQVYTERNPSGTMRGYGYAPIVEQTRLGTMHPAIRGMLDRRATGLFNPADAGGMPNPYTTGKVGTIIEEVPQGMEEDKSHNSEPTFRDEQPSLHTSHLENYMMKPYDPSLTGSYDGNMFRNVIPDDPNAKPRLSY